MVLYDRMDEVPGTTKIRRFELAENINELTSGRPAARIDLMSEDDPARAALKESDNDL